MSDDSANNDPMSAAFGLPPMPMDSRVKDLVVKGHDDSAESDFSIARANIHEIIDVGSFAIQKLSVIADASQNPTAFNALSNLMSTLLQANRDLLALQKDIREITKADEPTTKEAKQVTNQSLFVGSTAELADLINTMKTGGSDVVHVSNRMDKDR